MAQGEQANQPDSIQGLSLAAATAIDYVIDRLEGGSRLVEDSGGLTRYGISQRAYPDLDIRGLTRVQAVELYLRDYWHKAHAAFFMPGLDLLLFDAAVNLGVDQAARLLQRVLRVHEDGRVGPETISAAGAFLPASELRALYSEIRLRHYAELVARKPVYTQYLHGWRLRVMRVADEAGARAAR